MMNNSSTRSIMLLRKCSGGKRFHQKQQQLQQQQLVRRLNHQRQCYYRRHYHLSTSFCNNDTQDRNVDGNALSLSSSSSSSLSSSSKMIRLSKRMSELDLCSRREADRLITDGLVRIKLDVKKYDNENENDNDNDKDNDDSGRIAVLGEKVPSDISVNDIEIIISTKKSNGMSGDDESSTVPSSTVIHSVVLNKPGGYVSGQAEHGHPPAIRLLTRENYYYYDYQHQQRIRSSRIQRREREIAAAAAADDDDNDLMENHHLPNSIDFSWKGYAPAGRLDLDSTGLLVFTKNGVIAKKLLQDGSNIEKEYLVDVIPATRPTKHELRLDPSFQLPRTTFDLSRLTKGGETLLEENNKRMTEKQLESQAIVNDPKGRRMRRPSLSSSSPAMVRRSKPLKPCHVEWIDDYDDDDHTDYSSRRLDRNRNHFPAERNKMKLRFVLREGKKNQIKRMCRELIGWHVTHIHRVRIGPITILDNEDEMGNIVAKKKQSFLPVGCWRPLTQHEIATILGSGS